MNTDLNNSTPEEELDIKKYFYTFLSNWYWFILTISLSIAIAFIINRYTTPQFSASSTISILDGSDNDIAQVFNELGLFKRKRVKAAVENEIPVFQSFSLSRSVVEELKLNISYYTLGNVRTVELYKSSPFIISYDSTKVLLSQSVEINFIDETKYRLHYTKESTDESFNATVFYDSLYTDNNFSFSLSLKIPFEKKLKENNYSFRINSYDALASAYTKKLIVEQASEKASVLSLTMNGTIPTRIIDYLNKTVEVYIRREINEQNKSYENTISFIDEQLSIIVDSLTLAEANLELFRKNNNIIDLSEESKALFMKIQDVQERSSILNVEMKYYQYLLEYVENKKDLKTIVLPSVIGIQDQLLNSLVSQISKLYSERDLIEFNSNAKNPNIALIDLQIQKTKEALLENLNNVINSAAIEKQDINERLIHLNEEMKSLPATERRYVNIQRKFVLNDNIYTFLLEKRAEAGMAKASNMPNTKIIDIAHNANVRPISPKRQMNYMIAIFLGIIVPMIILIIIEFFNTTLSTVKDVEDRSEIPIVGIIPHSNLVGEKVVEDFPKSMLAETYRVLRFNIQYLSTTKKSVVIAISSTISGEGKTFTSLNLASIYNLSKKKTLIVGLDLRRPKLHERYNVQNDKGITSIVIGEHSIDDCIVKIEDHLDFLPSGPIAPNPAELIENFVNSSLVDELKQRYEIIIFDTPPLALVSDVMILNKVVDVTGYVVRLGYSTREVLSFVNSVNTEKKIANPALIINDVDESMRYGYGYGKYSKRYGSYRYSYNYNYYHDQHNTTNKVSRILNHINPFKKS